MAINYTAKPWIRTAGYVPTGSPGMPLLLRNPQTTNAAYDKEKVGPCVMLKFGATDYRMYYEGLNTTQYAPNTNFIMYATSPDGVNWTKYAGNPAISASLAWHNGEVCPSDFFWNQYTNEFWMYYHGGNNSGPRQVGLMTSPTGLPGSWTLYGTTPVFGPSSVAGAFDQFGVADARVLVLSATDYRMVYSGFRTSDQVVQVGYATSTDGKTWTRQANIIPLGSGNDANRCLPGDCYVDANGRVHLWYAGKSSVDNHFRVLYAYSDDWVTWTRNQADVIAARSATATDPDADEIGDTVRGFRDDGLRLFTQRALNISGYTGDALGRLEGRILHWLPEIAVGTPTRPGRVFSGLSGAREYSVVDPAAKLMNSTAFTVWADFRIPPGNTFREIYTERVSSTQQVFARINNVGKADVFFRTAAGNAAITSANRYDDNKWHRLMFVRRSAADFELYVDGVSVGTSAVSAGTDATATFPAWGNWHPSTGVGSEPVLGILRQGVLIQGRALTTAEELTLWNSGNDGGTLPAGVTATAWVKHGSGGAAGPDAPVGTATYGVSSVVGSVLVETTPRPYAGPSGLGAAPVATISFPSDNSFSTTQGSSTTFTGSATDTEDGTLTGASLSWASSINGVFGSGVAPSMASLSIGTHSITLTATDSLGNTGTATRTVTINAASVATVTDNFNRAINNTLGTATTGQVWSYYGGGGLVGLDGNGHAVTTAADSNSGAVIDSGSPNATVQATILSAGTDGLVFRHSDDLNRWDIFMNGGTVLLRKTENGVMTAQSVANSPLSGDVWAITCSGTSIVVKKNGVQKFSITDGFNASATKYGFLARPNAIYDDFSVANAASGGAATKFAVTRQPSGGQSGTLLSIQPQFQVQDVSSVLVTGDTRTATVTLNTISGSGTLSGTVSKAAANGNISFTDLVVTGTGTFTLTCGDGSLTSATTAQFSTSTRANSPYINLGSDGKDLGYDKSAVDPLIAIATSGDRRAVTEVRYGGPNTFFAYAGANRAQYPSVLLNTDLPNWATLSALPTHSVNSDAQLNTLLTNGSLTSGGHVVIIDNTVVYTGDYFGAFPLRSGGDAAPGGSNVVFFISKAFWTSMVANSGTCVIRPEKTRVVAGDLSNLAEFRCGSTLGNFKVNGPTKGWRFIGLKFTAAPGLVDVSHLCSLGDGSFQPDASYCPSNLGLDRCWIDGNTTGEIGHAVELQCINGYVIDSGFGQNVCALNRAESHCIVGWNGPGPFRIVNNGLVGGSQYIFFGGAYSSCGTPSDIEVRFNYMTCPLSWNPTHPTFAGIVKKRKCAFELKKARRVIVDGNLIENVWPESQTGYGLLLKSESYGDGQPTTADVVVRSNVIRNVGYGVNMAGVDNVDPAAPPAREICYNNLFKVGAQYFDASQNPLASVAYTRDCGHIHNTFISEGPVNVGVQLPGGNGSGTGMLLMDNIYDTSTYGWKMDSRPVSDLTFTAPNSVISQNVVITLNATTYPAGTYLPPNRNAIGFTNPAGDDWSLFSSSQGVPSPAIDTSLGYTTQPGNATDQVVLAVQPVVKVFDQFGVFIADYNGPVTLVGSGVTILQGGTVTAVNGVATFTTLMLGAAQTGLYSLVATAPGLASAQSNSATITVPTPPPPPPPVSSNKNLPRYLPSKFSAKYGKSVLSLFIIS